MKVGGNGQYFQIGTFNLPNVHAESVNPFRVIPVVTAAGRDETLFGVLYDVF
jgi:hypothetical protein